MRAYSFETDKNFVRKVVIILYILTVAYFFVQDLLSKTPRSDATVMFHRTYNTGLTMNFDKFHSKDATFT